MPRGHRFHLDGAVYHVTDRCHRKQFLLKFARDRRAWIRWLYQARKRYGLSVLNYNVTSNHVYLLVRDCGRGEIAHGMQLVAGCTARAYNARKRRRGAFWEDFYQATIVDTADHLARCFTYIDLNMVRAGVVDHPRQWRESGYWEIQNRPERYRIIDRAALSELLAVDESRLAEVQDEWIEAKLRRGELVREAQWSAGVAVGRRSFVDEVKDRLGSRARFRRVRECNGDSILREAGARYQRHPGPEMARLTPNCVSVQRQV